MDVITKAVLIDANLSAGCKVFYMLLTEMADSENYIDSCFTEIGIFTKIKQDAIIQKYIHALAKAGFLCLANDSKSNTKIFLANHKHVTSNIISYFNDYGHYDEWLD